MIFDDFDKEPWITLFLDPNENEKFQHFLRELIKEIDIDIVSEYPFNRSPQEFHELSMKLFTRKELLQQQLEFFVRIRQEFDKRLKEGT